MQFTWLFTFLSTVGAPLVKKVLVALGIGAVSVVGITVVTSTAASFMKTQLTGVPADIAQLLGLMKVDIAINIMISAVTTRMTIAGVNKATGTKSGLGNVGGN